MARKVNTRFLVILTLVVGGGVVGLYTAARVFGLGRTDPQEHLIAARQMAVEGKHDEAVEHYRTAISLRPNDAEVFIQFGDYFNNYAWVDNEYVYSAPAAWRRALEIDPDHLPALRRLLRFHQEAARLLPQPHHFQEIRNAAEKVARLDPDDSAAAAAVHDATLGGWLVGVATDERKVDQSIEALQELIRTGPPNPDLPNHVARALIKRAGDYRSGGQARQEAEAWAAAIGTIESALEAHAGDPMMHFRAGQIFMRLAELHPDQDQREQFAQRFAQEIQRAAEGIPPEHDSYFDVEDTAARLAIRDGDLKRAEAIYREALEKRPDDPIVRLTVGKFLGDAGHLDEAIALLSKPLDTGTSLKGAMALLAREIQVQSRIELGNLLLSASVKASSSQERDRLMAQVKTIYDETAKHGQKSAPLLRFRGRAELAQGKRVEGVQSLAKAKALLDEQGKRDEELNYLLARAYILTNQIGEAKALLGQILQRHPGMSDARLYLAQVLIRENAIEEARKHLDILEKEKPEDPNVLRLRLVTTDPNRKEDLRKYFDELPEGTRVEVFGKVQVGAALGYTEDAVRLLEELRAQKPGDPEAALLLSQLHVAQERKDQAVIVVTDALKHNPEHPGLKLLARQVSGEATVEELAAMRRSFAMDVKDDFEREMRLADLAKLSNDQAAYEQHLKLAEKIRPNDGKLCDALFHLHLNRNELDKAQAYLERLQKANHDDAGGLLYSFKLAAARSDERAAMEIAREVVKRYPEFARAWLTLGQAQQGQGRFEEAIQSFNRALEKQGDSLLALQGLVQCHYALNQSETAAAFIARGRSVLPSDLSFRELEINHELNYGQPENAITPLEELVQINPHRGDLTALLGAAYMLVGQQKTAAGEDGGPMLEKARSTLDEALQRWPDERTVYVHLGELLIRQQDYEGAEKLYQAFAAREVWKDRPEPALMLAQFYASAGNLLAAEEAARLALDRSSGAPDVRRQLADVLARQAKIPEALEMLQPLKGQVAADLQRAALLVKIGRAREAESTLLESLGQNSDSLSLLSALASLYYDQRKYELAMERLNRLLELDPQNAAARYHRGQVRLRSGHSDPEQAIADLVVARDVRPKDPQIRMALVEAYRRYNKPELAINEMEALLKENPQNRQIRLALIDGYTALTVPNWKQVERLIREAQANMQMGLDPIWYERGALMWAARENPAKALEQSRRAMEMASGDRTVRTHLDVLIQVKEHALLLEETDRMFPEGSRPWWASSARAVARNRLGEREASLAEFEAALATVRQSEDEAATEVIIRTMARELGVAEALARIEEKAKKEPRWRLIAALLYQNNQDFENAVRMCDLIVGEATDLEPRQRLMALRIAGTIYQSARPEPLLDRAEEAYRKALEVNGEDLASLNNLASLLADRDGEESARQALVYSEKAYTIMRKAGALYPFVVDTHGWALTKVGRVDEGIDLLLQAVEKEPSADSHYHLAVAYLYKSEPDEARGHLQRADRMLRELELGDSPYDSSLRRKIDDALTRADGMIRAKSRAQAE